MVWHLCHIAPLVHRLITTLSPQLFIRHSERLNLSLFSLGA
jgi:hypothetical protein